jgi:hypothetical protein
VTTATSRKRFKRTILVIVVKEFLESNFVEQCFKTQYMFVLNKHHLCSNIWEHLSRCPALHTTVGIVNNALPPQDGIVVTEKDLNIIFPPYLDADSRGLPILCRSFSTWRVWILARNCCVALPLLDYFDQ